MSNRSANYLSQFKKLMSDMYELKTYDNTLKKKICGNCITPVKS